LHRQLLSQYLLPYFKLWRNKKGHRYIMSTSGPARPNERHASDARFAGRQTSTSFHAFFRFSKLAGLKWNAQSPVDFYIIQLSSWIINFDLLPGKHIRSKSLPFEQL